MRASMIRVLAALLVLLTVGWLASPAPVIAGDEVIDEDEDGFGVDEDCDDTDEDVNPDAEEVCDDDIDNDCDGTEWLSTQDLDGDGESPNAEGCGGTDCDDNDASLNSADEDGDEITSCNGDCDDSAATGAAAGPGQEEICGDSIDNDCSGGADDEDLDGDGFLSPDCGGDDCNDDNATTNPEAGETGATCGDGVDNDCDQVIDEADEDCFEEPEVDAGIDQQSLYIGGNVVLVFDGSGTTDANENDVLSYTWTLAGAAEDYPGVTYQFITDSTSPYAYLRFHADPAAEATSWDFEATLVVSDGVHTTAADDEKATVSAHIYRPQTYSSVGCALASGSSAGLFGLAFMLLLGLGRRRS
ncbi:MAG: hypothetical protein CMP23_08130 [Rickettsiales bacterium]|nr:hypothetical protein [Rickettsiales bacterium]|tara:strand:- start:1033 stop:2106 length:1074 start_codon:yes stop_codon:yes gene_type:complete